MARSVITSYSIHYTKLYDQAHTGCRTFDPAQYAGEGLRCLIALPIFVNGRALACLNLAGRRTAQISAATCQVV